MAKKHFSLRRLSLPIFWDLLSRFLTLIINTTMISHYSNDLVGAMGAGNQIFDFFIIIFSFLSVGCSVLIAQAVGARNENLARRVIHQSLVLNTLLGLACAVFILINASLLLGWLNIPAELAQPSQLYLHMLAFGLFFDAISMVLGAILRVYNGAWWVMVIGFSMDFVVMVGNFYVLHFTQLELFGVGLANVIARIFCCVALGWVMIYKFKIHLALRDFVLKWAVVKKILNIGGFSAGENLLWTAQYTITLAFIALLGKEALAVQTIYFQLSLLIMLVGASMSLANEIIVGKLIGARYENIAYKHTWMVLYFSVAITAGAALIHFALRDWTMDLLGLREELRRIMLPLFGLSIFLEICRTFNIVMVNALRASGDARFPFFTGLVFMMGVSVPVGYFLCFHAGLGIVGIWLGYCADECLRGLVNAARWKSRKWQGRALV